MGRLFPVLSDGCQDIGAGVLPTPGYSRYRRAATWKSLRSMCKGRHVSGSVSCFVPNIVLFSLLALEPRPLLTCSVLLFPTVICSAATQVSLGTLPSFLHYIRLRASGVETTLSITNALSPGQSQMPLSRVQLCFRFRDHCGLMLPLKG